MSAKFQIEKSADGHFYFHLKAGNGEIILSSQQYKAKAGAQHGIESVKVNALLDGQFERKKSVSDQPFFTLKAANGEILGRSQMYSSESSMEKGIESVKANATTAVVQDDTRGE